MKTLIVLCVVLLSGCSALNPKVGDYVGGKDRCYIGGWGCQMEVQRGYLVAGEAVNLKRVGGEIGGGKPPKTINDMPGWN